MILGLDLGTTGNKAMVFSEAGEKLASAYSEFKQHFPNPGWVEHDPIDILQTALKVLKEVSDQIDIQSIKAFGITNQRETTILWDAETGKPIYNAIVWQCRRTTEICKTMTSHAAEIKDRTGLFLDPYFSATKIKWIFDNVQEAKILHNQGRLRFGTVDTWLIWHLTKGQTHATDISNASRTLLFNLKTKQYDPDLLNLFGIPRSILPDIRDCDAEFGMIHPSILGREIPILSVMGDQQASLFAHGGWNTPVLKNTYGTGLFLTASMGKEIPKTSALISTVAWTIQKQTEYAIEGSIFVGGSAVQWLRDGLHLIDTASETEALARSIPDNDELYFVPALTGLGAPHWVPNARGILVGLTRGTTPAHIVRATLESLAFQTADVIKAIQKECDHTFTGMKVDGGGSQNDFLMQFQADILNLSVDQTAFEHATILGTAGLAGITANVWDYNTVLAISKPKKSFTPKISSSVREKLLTNWEKVLEQCISFYRYE